MTVPSKAGREIGLFVPQRAAGVPLTTAKDTVSLAMTMAATAPIGVRAVNRSHRSYTCNLDDAA
jgi:hypothetical protein